MNKKYVDYLLHPLVLTLASIIIYFFPIFATLDKWIIAILWIVIVWIVSLYRYVMIAISIDAHHPTSITPNVNEIILLNNINERDVILQVKCKVITKAGRFFFDRLIKHLVILMTYDTDFLKIDNSEKYNNITDKEKGYEINLFRHRDEEHHYSFLLNPGDKRSGKVQGTIDFEINSSSHSKIINCINDYIVTRKTKKYLKQKQIDIIVQ